MQMSPQDWVYITSECVTGLLSILGNALVLIAIWRTRALHTVTNCFIGSLAAADILVGIVIPPSVILSYLGLPRHFEGCVLLNSLVVLITNISILNLVAVALERFIAISNPFRYQQLLTIRRAMIVVVVTWLVAILLGLVPTMGWNLGPEGFEFCAFTKVIGMNYMVYLIFFGVNIPPLVFMLIIYIYIFHIVRKQRKRMVAQMMVLSVAERRNARQHTREVRGARSLAYVIILFAASWMPIHILNSVTLFVPEKQAPIEVFLVAIVLSHANSFVNPILYAYGNSKFKAAMKRILCCGRMHSTYGSDSSVDINSRAVPRLSIAGTNGIHYPPNGTVVNGHATIGTVVNGHANTGEGHDAGDSEQLPNPGIFTTQNSANLASLQLSNDYGSRSVVTAQNGQVHSLFNRAFQADEDSIAKTVMHEESSEWSGPHNNKGFVQEERILIDKSLEFGVSNPKTVKWNENVTATSRPSSVRNECKKKESGDSRHLSGISGPAKSDDQTLEPGKQPHLTSKDPVPQATLQETSKNSSENSRSDLSYSDKGENKLQAWTEVHLNANSLDIKRHVSENTPEVKTLPFENCFREQSPDVVFIRKDNNDCECLSVHSFNSDYIKNDDLLFRSKTSINIHL